LWHGVHLVVEWADPEKRKLVRENPPLVIFLRGKM